MSLFNTRGPRRKTVGAIIVEFFKSYWNLNDIFYNHNCQAITEYAWLKYKKSVSYGTVERQLRHLRESGALKMVEIQNKRKEKGWKVI
tara:strand:- start:1136 stop:1399 length:264 start_codon:yes stop_codon:yes gene_type:complete